jgi:hypothetical protein
MDQLAKSKTLSPKKPERKGLEVGLKWRASESPKFKPQQWEKKKKTLVFISKLLLRNLVAGHIVVLVFCLKPIFPPLFHC